MEISTGTPFLKKVLRSKAFTLFLLLVAMCAAFAIIAAIKGAKFLNIRTFASILSDLTIPGFLAIGASFLLVSGCVDLSEWASGALAGMIVAVGIDWWGWPWYAAVLLAIGIVLVIGFLNATFVNVLGMAPFIATMAMSSIVQAITMLVSTTPDGILKGVANFNNDVLSAVVKAGIGRIPYTVFVMLIVFIIYGIILSKTKLGRSIYMIGGNANAARLTGINSKGISYFLFMNCSLMGGLAGLVYTFRSKQGSISALSSDQFTGMTAAILGGVSFGGGNGNLAGVFVGLLILNTFSKGMVAIGSSSYWTTIMTGVLLLVALIIDSLAVQKARKSVR